MARALSGSRADLALAVVLATYALVEGLVIDAPASRLVATPLAMLLLTWRRVWPLPVIAGVLGTSVLLAAVGSDSDGSVLPLPLIIVVAFTAAREAPSGGVALLGGAAIGAWALLGLGFASSPAENTSAEDVAALLVLIGAAVGTGRMMRIRHAETQTLRSLTAQLAAERDLRARAAVAEERARVTRELHDIVAHSVSLIAVQAGAAEELLGRDEARARQSLQAVQETARSALGEMRGLLTVLRGDGEAPGLAPQPGLAALGDLVERAQAGGIPVELCERGARGDAPAGIDLAAFRIVQEALTNVRKHAPAAPTEVLVRYGRGAIVVEVSNALDDGVRPASDGPSYGIAGMRERGRMYGGTLDAGPRDGRYVVRAQLPIGGAAG